MALRPDRAHVQSTQTEHSSRLRRIEFRKDRAALHIFP